MELKLYLLFLTGVQEAHDTCLFIHLSIQSIDYGTVSGLTNLYRYYYFSTFTFTTPLICLCFCFKCSRKTALFPRFSVYLIFYFNKQQYTNSE